MGRKDANGMQSAPVEQYRKQIGKHDYKKSKKKLQSIKDARDLKKSSSPVKDTILIVITGLCVVMGLYFLLYWYLEKDLPVV
ncbi:hypothetical protein ACF0H5_006559 [Mactra antiquata]